MNPCVLSLVAQATGEDLCLEIKLNNQTKFNQILSTEAELIKIDIEEIPDHTNVLEIIMTGKQSDHTVVDSDGSIIKDRLINISNFSFDEIELEQLFLDHAIYVHDFNGTAEKIQDRFFGSMGCNGIVYLEFTSPVYLWLLENM